MPVKDDIAASVSEAIGFSTPRTRTGKSALVQPMPHYISVDAIHVGFRAGDKAARNFLPPGLEPVEGGLGWIMIGELTKLSGSDLEQSWRNPDRCNYNECVLGLFARHGDRIGRYSALVWVDRDWSVVMGQVFGWGKKLATINRTRVHPLNGGLKRLGRHKLGGTVDRGGVRLISAAVDFGAEPKVIDKLPDYGSTTFLHRYIASAGPGIPSQNMLMELKLSDIAMSKVMVGKAELNFQGSEDEELDLFNGAEILEGYAYQRSWTTDAVASLVHDYNAE